MAWNGVAYLSNYLFNGLWTEMSQSMGSDSHGVRMKSRIMTEDV